MLSTVGAIHPTYLHDEETGTPPVPPSGEAQEQREKEQGNE
jgi:hypothetical protein